MDGHLRQQRLNSLQKNGEKIYEIRIFPKNQLSPAEIKDRIAAINQTAIQILNTMIYGGWDIQTESFEPNWWLEKSEEGYIIKIMAYDGIINLNCDLEKFIQFGKSNPEIFRIIFYNIDIRKWHEHLSKHSSNADYKSGGMPAEMSLKVLEQVMGAGDKI